MKTVIEMAIQAGCTANEANAWGGFLERFSELVRADERNSWPLEMEAMERQVNILTDALAEARVDEREACAKVCETEWSNVAERMYGEECAATIRARGNT